jgi:hypothetical protein
MVVASRFGDIGGASKAGIVENDALDGV